jgi:hypothetical protein
MKCGATLDCNEKEVIISCNVRPEKDGNIEYGNIVERKREHRNGNIEKLLKSGELRKKVPHSHFYNNTSLPVI